MTTVQSPPAPPTAIRPRVVARTGLYAVLAANAAVVAYFFAQAGFASNALIVIGRLFGLYGALVMAFQLVLVARLPWLDRRIGMDRLTSWHRWTGFALLWTLLAHVVFITFGYAEGTDVGPVSRAGRPRRDHRGRAPRDRRVRHHPRGRRRLGPLRPPPPRLRDLALHPPLHLRRRGARLHAPGRGRYDLHLVVRRDGVLVRRCGAWPSARSSWAGSCCRCGATPATSSGSRQSSPSPTTSSRSTSPAATSTRLPAQAGQFFLWRFLTRDRWWQANPFSLSAAPDGRTLRLTAKAAGDGSAALRHLKVGTRVFAEGPYGAFTALHRTKSESVLIAGGVGVTPIRALLEDLEGHAVVIYRVASDRDAVLYDELRDLALAKGAELHLVTGPPVPDKLAPRELARLVPDIADRDVFLCGPPPMMNAVLRQPGRPGRAQAADPLRALQPGGMRETS